MPFDSSTTMLFDSSTLCARTAAGEAELATPSQGLSLGQRRVLALLQSPSAVDELAEKFRLEPEKLARDLTRLADLRLVLLQGPTAPAAEPPPPAQPMSRVVIGPAPRKSSSLPAIAGVAALLLAAGIWYATRAPSTTPVATPSLAAASAAAPAAALVPISAAVAPSPPAASAPVTESAAPALAAILRTKTSSAEMRPGTRPEMKLVSQPAAQAAAPSPPTPARSAAAPDPRPMARPEASADTAVSPLPPAPQAPLPTVAPAVAADTPPVQLASAAPTIARPLPAAERKALSRDPPDFPREAIDSGLKSGLVTARLHIDARGSVTGVDILASQPPKVFDRATRRALMFWQFEPSASGHAAELDVDVKFQRD